jgi:hypothetical protein
VNSPFRIASFALVLSLVPSLAPADEPTLAERAQARVQEGLTKPLAQYESHSFSRSRPPPRERRVRIPQTTASVDKKGRAFVPFAIDVRFAGSGSEWRENDIVGCMYSATGSLFVKRGDVFRPASFLLGKNEDPVPDVCVAVEPARS